MLFVTFLLEKPHQMKQPSILLFILILWFTYTPIASSRVSNPDHSLCSHNPGKLLSDCSWNGIELSGSVQFVESFPDIKIQIVESFPDIKVKLVESFADDCGEWQVVESFPDFKVQIVESFPDLKVQYVESFPGIPVR